MLTPALLPSSSGMPASPETRACSSSCDRPSATSRGKAALNSVSLLLSVSDRVDAFPGIGFSPRVRHADVGNDSTAHCCLSGGTTEVDRRGHPRAPRASNNSIAKEMKPTYRAGRYSPLSPILATVINVYIGPKFVHHQRMIVHVEFGQQPFRLRPNRLGPCGVNDDGIPVRVEQVVDPSNMRCDTHAVVLQRAIEVNRVHLHRLTRNSLVSKSM